MALGQQPFNPEFTDNPEQRCPVVLLLDTSYSMSGEPLAALNEGVRIFRETLLDDEVAAKRVEIAIISFGPVREQTGFVSAESFVAPTLQAGGDTPIGAAITAGIELLDDRKQQIRAHGVNHYRPWIMLITDGAPTDDWKAAAQAVHQGEKNRSFAFFAIGVDGADMTILQQIAPPERAPIALKGLNFRELFLWLSGSLKAVSGSKPAKRCSCRTRSPADGRVSADGVADWRWAAARAAGTSHDKVGAPCQDAWLVRTVDGPGGATLIAVASDGAGSARRSREGSRAAVRHVANTAAHWFSAQTDLPEEADVRYWLAVLRGYFQAEAVPAGEMRAFAATLIGACVTSAATLVFHVGDGACVLHDGSEWLVGS